jgi:hypothetical protein
MAKPKKFTANELAKAIEEAYELGFKHAQKGVRPPMSSLQLSISHLAKSIDGNSHKINDDLLKQPAWCGSWH